MTWGSPTPSAHPHTRSNYHHAIAWHRALYAHGHRVQMWRIYRHIGMGGDKIVAAPVGGAGGGDEGEAIRAAECGAHGG